MLYKSTCTFNRITHQHITKISLILHETAISQSINHLYDQVHVQVTFKQGLMTLCCKLHITRLNYAKHYFASSVLQVWYIYLFARLYIVHYITSQLRPKNRSLISIMTCTDSLNNIKISCCYE